MRPNAQRGVGPIQAKDNDPRVTKFGRFLRKTAMDELPQLAFGSVFLLEKPPEKI